MIKRLVMVILAAAMITILVACGGNGEKQETAKTTEPVTETEAQTTEKETTKPSETTTAATTAQTTSETTTEPATEPGPFSAPEAFEGFSYSEYFNGSTGSSTNVVFGSTTFGELGSTDIKMVLQDDGDKNRRPADTEAIEAGAICQVITTQETKLGGVLSFMVYNPSEGTSSLEDCVILGISDDEGLKFPNGIRYGSSIDEIIAVLGEPNEVTAKSQWTFVYCWRDESREHELTLTVYEPETVGEIDGMTYIDYSVVGK